jgi:hypothetical protein
VERQIHVLLNTQITEIVRSDSHVEQLELSDGSKSFVIHPAAVIDASGTAEVVRQLDPSLVADDGQRAAGGWIFRVRGVAKGALDFPKGVGIVRVLREAALKGTLPRPCAHAWLDIGTFPDEVFVKLMVPLTADLRDPRRRRQIIADSQAMEAKVFQFLKQLPEFVAAYVSQSGSLGVRDGGRVRGRCVLTGDDVRYGRSFPDAVCRGAWPIEYWDPERGVSMEYLAPRTHYEIPMQALQLSGLDNLWVAGKCLSADREAHASARVAGTCWAMGAAVGAAAAAQARVHCESSV